MAKRSKIKFNVKGMREICSTCNREIGNTSFCKKYSDIPLNRCPNISKHRSKIIVYDSYGKRRTKVLTGKTKEERMHQGLEFRKMVKDNKHIEVRTESNNALPVPQAMETSAPTLMQAITYYTMYLDGNRGASHTRKKVSKHHRDDVENSLIMLAKIIKKKGIDPETITINNISQEIIGDFYDFLLKEKNYKPRTFNRVINNASGLWRYTNKFENCGNYKNPFDQVIRKRPGFKDPVTIEPHELKALLNIITEDKGMEILKSGDRKQRYFPFLSLGIRIAYLCPFRREDLVNLRFSNVKENDKGVPDRIVSDNRKVNKILKLDDSEDQKIIVSPIVPQLLRILENELNYSQNRGSDKFLIADDSELQRSTIVDCLSKAFSFYWKKLNYEKEASFADCRKSFINRLQLVMGDNSRIATGHSKKYSDILDKHYLSKEFFSKLGSYHNLYPELDQDDQRIDEIKEIRTKRIDKSNSLER